MLQMKKFTTRQNKREHTISYRGLKTAIKRRRRTRKYTFGRSEATNSNSQSDYQDAPDNLFDEATSALDNETEKYINKTVMSVKKDKLILMIAHRPSTIETADCRFEV